jgi:hypothetical protein
VHYFEEFIQGKYEDKENSMKSYPNTIMIMSSKMLVWLLDCNLNNKGCEHHAIQRHGFVPLSKKIIKEAFEIISKNCVEKLHTC